MSIPSLFVLLNALIALALPAVMTYGVFFSPTSAPFFTAALCLILLLELISYFVYYRSSVHPRSMLGRDLLFFCAWLSAYFWLPNQEFGLAFGFLSVPLIFAIRLLLGFSHTTIISTQTILIAIGLSTIPFAMQQYFSFSHGWVTLIVFVWTVLLASSTLGLTPQPTRTQLLFSLIVGFLSTEIYISLLFLPYHFTTLGVLLLLGFYWFWNLAYQYLSGALNRRKVQFYSALCTGLAVLAFLMSPWQPV